MKTFLKQGNGNQKLNKKAVNHLFVSLHPTASIVIEDGRYRVLLDGKKYNVCGYTSKDGAFLTTPGDKEEGKNNMYHNCDSAILIRDHLDGRVSIIQIDKDKHPLMIAAAGKRHFLTWIEVLEFASKKPITLRIDE